MSSALFVLIAAAHLAYAADRAVIPPHVDSTAARADSTASDSALTVRFGGFVDLYYAYDFQRPSALDRSFSTTAARHNEFNVNLAFLEAVISAPRVRGRFAAQFGTSVQANFAAEPRVGQYSGPDVSRFIQEAYLGYQLRDGLWIDAGVFFAPFGAENWISRDNPVYTRSLIADNSPYYESGMRLAWQATPVLQLQAHVINGWQNVSETNEDKALALRADWEPLPWLSLSHDTFLGNEQPDSVPSRVRQFHEVILRWTPSARTALAASLDYGRQPRVETTSGWDDGSASWRGFAVLARQTLAPTLSIGARVEGYSDPEQVIVATGAAGGLRARGISFNADAAPHPRALWRTELRALRTRDPVLPDGPDPDRRVRRNTVIVSSFAVTF